MSTENSAPEDFLGLGKAKAFVTENQRVLLAGGLVLAAVIAAVAIYREWSAHADHKGWSAFLLAGKELTAEQQKDVAGTSAEPWFLYRSAVVAFNDKKYDEAAGFLKTLQDRYPGHFLTYAHTLYDPEHSLASQLSAAVQVEQDWAKTNPRMEANPEPPKDQTCTLKTAKGDIVLGLYLDRAPENCKMLIRNAAAMKGQYIRSVSADLFVIAGQALSKDATTSTPKEGREAPVEETGLYHFKGAVSFEPGYTASVEQENLPLFIAVAPNLNRDDQQTVFATVTQGLDKLVEWSKEKRGEGESAMDLAEPIRIDDVQLQITKEGWDVSEIQKAHP
ncbi:MAG: peptidylprolyl isomerase [Planctomycetota bacterium]